MTSRNISFEMATVNDTNVSSASSSDLNLHMSFEVSSFEEDRDEHLQNIAPLRFKPEATDSSKSDETSEDDVDDQRRGNTDW